jgi:hypothetical protein
MTCIGFADNREHLARILLIVHRAQINASTNQTDFQGDLP